MRSISLVLLFTLILSCAEGSSDRFRKNLRRCILITALSSGAVVGELKNERPSPSTYIHLLHYLTGPATTGLQMVGSLRHSDAFLSAAYGHLQQDYGFLMGYAAIYLSLEMAAGRILNIKVDEYDEACDRYLKGRPQERVLYLSSFVPGDEVGEFSRFYFDHRYGKNSNNRFESFRGAVGLRRLLKRLEDEVARDLSTAYDQIIFFAHGDEEAVQFADGKWVSAEEMENVFGERRYRIARPGAGLRFISCALAKRQRDSMLRVLGKALLADGGTSLGATRVISILDRDWKPRGYVPPPRTPLPVYDGDSLNLPRWFQLSTGVANFFLGLELLATFDRLNLADIVVTEIPPQKR